MQLDNGRHLLAGDGHDLGTACSQRRRPSAERDDEVLGRADVEPEALRDEALLLALLERSLKEDVSRDTALSHLEQRGARDGPRDEDGLVLLDVRLHRGREVRDARRRRASAAVVPGGDDEGRDDGDADDGEHDHAPFGAPVMVLPDANASRPYGAWLLVDPEPRRVLVHEELAVEAEVVRVRAEEALDVRLAWQDVEALGLERAQVLRADLRRALCVGDLDALVQARFPKAGTDLEHLGRPGFYETGPLDAALSPRRG